MRGQQFRSTVCKARIAERRSGGLEGAKGSVSVVERMGIRSYISNINTPLLSYHTEKQKKKPI